MPQRKTSALGIAKPAVMSLPELPAWLPELEQWEHARYDGIKGLLPSWIPSSLQKKFRHARFDLFFAIRQDTAKYDAIKSRFDDLVKMKYPAIVLQLARDERPHNSSLLILVDFYKAVQLGEENEEKGLALLTDPSLAGLITKGKRYGKHQSRIAQNPRGKIEEAAGETINKMIGRLAKGRPDESAKELWSHFYSRLDEHSLNPEENSQKGVIEYDFKSKRKPITFGTFEKVVSQYRTGRKKLP